MSINRKICFASDRIEKLLRKPFACLILLLFCSVFFNHAESETYFNENLDVERSLAGATAYEFAEISVHLKGRVQKSYSLQVLPRPLLGKDDATLPNIYVIMFDEISRNHFRRKVPESNKFMETEMNMVHFKKFASITDSLRDNFFATVSGMLRIFLFHIKLIFRSQDVQVFAFLTIPSFAKSVAS